MISLSHVRPDTPPEFADAEDPAWPEDVKKKYAKIAAERAKIAEMIARQDFPRSSDFKEIWRDYRDDLSDVQHDKCAYCECDFSAGYPGAVEHYRPKTEWRELKMTSGGQVPTFERGKSHKPGYWWLAFDYDNYVYSCGSCNGAKANYFPVEGYRPKLREGSHNTEAPRLLNPYVDDPDGHFLFDEVGLVRGLTAAGKWTVRVCDFRRTKLVKSRKKIITTIERDFSDYEVALELKNNLARQHSLRRLRDHCLPEAPYTAMARQLVERWTHLSYDELNTIVEADIS